MDILRELGTRDYEQMSSRDFSKLIRETLETLGEVRPEVFVNDRGDGRRGRVDYVLITEKETIGIEIDRKSPRTKSIFKLKQLGADRIFCITKTPFSVQEIEQ